MAFGTITTNAKSFNSIGPGVYQLSTVAFGQPANLFKIAGGKRTNAKSPTTASVSRHLEKDVTVNGVVERRKASVVAQVTVPDGFTTAEIAGMLQDIDLWVDDATLSRTLMGES